MLSSPSKISLMLDFSVLMNYAGKWVKYLRLERKISFHSCLCLFHMIYPCIYYVIRTTYLKPVF